MNLTELKNLFQEIEIINNKLVVKSNILKILAFIKENYKFNLLKSITAVDLQELGVELIYNLYSVENEEELLISTLVNKVTESVSSIFDSAVADEKEIYDLFGIEFNGNKELKRLYLPDDWKGHPLKKDYVEDDERLRWND